VCVPDRRLLEKEGARARGRAEAQCARFAFAPLERTRCWLISKPPLSVARKPRRIRHAPDLRFDKASSAEGDHLRPRCVWDGATELHQQLTSEEPHPFSPHVRMRSCVMRMTQANHVLAQIGPPVDRRML